MEQQQHIRRIPYGVPDFVNVRTRDLYYVDKTMYLPKLEEACHFIFFIRPRRFGKSLFIDMMQAYYDKAMGSRFDELFTGLWIHEHPTPNRGRYQVMRLDFSYVSGAFDELRANFNAYCNTALNSFMNTYKDDYPEDVHEEVRSTKDAGAKFTIINNAAKRLGIPLYLIVDEYDSFSNLLLNEEGYDPYNVIEDAEDFYIGVFKKFKPMFERIFLTGVTPINLNDLTSGFSIAVNVSTEPKFNSMLGFTTEDVRQMITYYKNVGLLPETCDIEQTLEQMKPWYGNYCFAKESLTGKSRVFNSDMVLYYLNYYIGVKHPLRDMVDPNTTISYNKMKRLIKLDKEGSTRKTTIQRITEEGQIIGNVSTSFPASDLTKPEMFISQLFYYGMLTMKGVIGTRLVLGIPNNNVRKQYYDYMLDQYNEVFRINLDTLAGLYDAMAFDGEWRGALEYLAKAYGDTSAVRSSLQGERNIQGFFLAYLSLNVCYLTAPELELNHGFCDFFLLPDLTHYPTKHCYIIELKYLSKEDYAAKAETQWQEAIEQINRYSVAPRVEKLRQGTQLHKIIVQFEGWGMKRMEEV